MKYRNAVINVSPGKWMIETLKMQRELAIDGNVEASEQRYAYVSATQICRDEYIELNSLLSTI